MSQWSRILQSTVGKKFASGLTGLALVGFVIVHLIGNLTLFAGAEAMNVYAHTLHNLGGGVVVYIAEAALAGVFLVHIITGLQVYFAKRKARPVPYARTADAGATSKKSSSSMSMAYTGMLILCFVVFHIYSFKLGPNETDGYIALHNGVEMRDIYRLVVEKFKNEFYTFGYVAMMALMGWHLRHGIWSAFQSLGLTSPKALPFLITFGTLLAVALAVGFIMLPIYIYFAA